MKTEGTAKTAKNIGKIALWTTVIIIALVIVILLIRFVIKRVAKSKSQKTADAAEKEVVKRELTYSDSEYKSLADRMYNAMKGIGTNETAIFDVLGKMKNKSDWNKLVSEFGVRDDFSLIEWLQDDLDESEISQISTILRRIDVNIF